MNTLYAKFAPRVIPLTQGLSVLVDAEDYAYLSQWKWYAKSAGTGQGHYAARSVRDAKRIRTIRMHRLLMQKELDAAPGFREVDHRNRIRLDNRRKNLRVVTKQDNLKNRVFKKKSHIPF